MVDFLKAVAFLWTVWTVCGAEQCKDPIPGVTKMLRGVDITKLDLLPLEVVTDDGFKNPVINFSCNQHDEWHSKEGAVFYQQPDQVWQATTVPVGWVSNTVKLYKTSSDIKESLAWNVGAEGSFKKFGFSASHSYRKMQDIVTNTSRFISDVTAFESATKINLNPHWVLRLDEFAQMFLDNMVHGSYNSSPGDYQQFIQHFGTHYFSSASFGGYIRVLQETNEDYFFTHTDKDVETNARASFLDVISVHGGRTVGSTSVSSTFSKSSSKTTRYYGGDTNLLQANGFNGWQPTVDKDPWLFSGTLKPISDLIRDPEKKISMVQAVEQYVLKSYLDELQRLIYTGKAKMSHSILAGLEKRLMSMRGLGKLVSADVGKLSDDVRSHLVVPEWFVDNTKMCFKWRAEDDGGQCSAASREICAKPNTMTSPYRDDTDGRRGGCFMQWGIKTSGGLVPDWFKEIAVCFRWSSDGHSGQCGGPKEVCANVNSFSSQYRDDTDGRDGGCKMSWKLKVPSSAPLWMQTSKMCFSWSADGDSRQCGPAETRDMCAVANHWTPYYRDDTDHRNGGCKMRWGLQPGM